ncbi:MAG: hypothetical protein ACHQRM_09435 [Bacteroidia bacterium]
MKQTYALILFYFFLFLVFSNPISAQNPDNPNNLHNPVWLGFNGGGAWQTSNVGAAPGGGAGMTLGKNYLTYTHSKFFVGWRFRYMGGITFGQDYTKNFGIINNAALNGTNDPGTDYVNNGGFVYNNYMMTYTELNLELLFGPNLIHKKTGSGPLLYLFGGLGMVKTQAFINAKDGNGNMYSYAQYDTAARNQGMSVSDYVKSKLDNSYETAADGNAAPVWKLMPSLGLGLGYQFRNVFQIGAEYKITFAGNTPIDGIQWDGNNNPLTSHNKINYASFFLKFGFGDHNPHSNTITPYTSDGYNGHNTIVTNPPPPPVGYPPVIYINAPNINPCAINVNEGQLNAQIQHVAYAGDIRVTLNGTQVSSWHFNPADGMFSGDFKFIPGTNSVIIYAGNSFGTDTKSQYFEYTPVIRNYPSPPPVITITSPGQNPFNTSANQVNVTAIVNNVENANEIQLKINGIGYSNFYFDPGTRILQFTAPLGTGNNYVYIQAMNNGGMDSKNLNIYFTPTSYADGLPPVVMITNPATNPYLTNTTAVTLSAQVQNLSANGQLQLTLNGQAHTDYNFDPVSGMLQFNFTAYPGNNYIYLTASNNLGTSSKNLDVIFTPAAPPAPVVIITTPAYSPSTSVSGIALVRATVSNVSDPHQIQVSDNGNTVNNFSFYPGSGALEFMATLSSGNNIVTISASNTGGTAAQSTSIAYSLPSVPRPLITVLSPLGRPYISGSNTITVRATVDNITGSSQVQATLGTAAENVVYNPLNHIMEFTATLNDGDNLFSITANNAGGFDSKTVDVVYNPVTMPVPVVTIQSPSTPCNTNLSNAVVRATVLNVQNQNQIHVLLNGQGNANFSYSLLSKTLVFSANLVPGRNTVSILAANDAGSDNKEVEINSISSGTGGGGGGGGLPKPTVTITSPASNPYTSSGNVVSVMASATNIASRNDIHILVNGVNLTVFTFDPNSGLINFSSYLNPGSNSLHISVSNASGSDGKNLLVSYTPAPPSKPVITILNPARNPLTISMNNLSLEARIDNITTSSQVQVRLNGQAYSSFTFNPVTSLLELNPSLISGRNTIIIQAINTTGNDEKTQEVDLSPVPAGPKPVITITQPNSNPFNTSASGISLTASVSNIFRATDVQVSENGIPLTGMIYNSGNGQLNGTAVLRQGANNFTFTATNSNGSDVRNLIVNYTPPASLPKPVITITSPNSPNFRTADPYTPVMATIQNVSGSMAITVTHNSATVPFSFDPNSKVLTIREHLALGNNIFDITASNSSGSDMQSVSLVNTQRPSVGNGTGNGSGNGNGNGNGIGTGPATGIGNGTGGNLSGTGIHVNQDGGPGIGNRPVIQLLSPNGNPAVVRVPNSQVTLLITGIGSPSEINVSLNGLVITSGVSYSYATHSVTIVPNLALGMNNLTVSVTNASGTAVKNVSIQYSPTSMRH